MVELNGSGNLLDDSGSESELLDLTTIKTARRGTYSCGRYEYTEGVEVFLGGLYWNLVYICLQSIHKKYSVVRS